MLRINKNPIGTKHNLPSFAEGGGQRWDQYTVEDTAGQPNFMPVADGVVLHLVYSGPKQQTYPQTYITMTLKMLAATGMPETKEDVFWETKHDGGKYIIPGSVESKGILGLIDDQNADTKTKLPANYEIPDGNPDILTD
jgi:hypothetical protein